MRKPVLHSFWTKVGAPVALALAEHRRVGKQVVVLLAAVLRAARSSLVTLQVAEQELAPRVHVAPVGEEVRKQAVARRPPRVRVELLVDAEDPSLHQELLAAKNADDTVFQFVAVRGADARTQGVDVAALAVLPRLQITDHNVVLKENATVLARVCRENASMAGRAFFWRAAWPASTAAWAGLLALGPASEIAARDSPEQAAEGANSARVCSAADLQALRRHRFVVVDGVLSATELAEAHKAAAAMHEARGLLPTEQDSATARSDCVAWVRGGEECAPALRVALRRLRGVAHEIDTDIAGRGAWCGFDDDNARRGSRRSRSLGVPVDGQLARYGTDEGSGWQQRYAAHRDGTPLPSLSSLYLSSLRTSLVDAPSAGAREVTAILYLNGSSWDEEDGDGVRQEPPKQEEGALVLYMGAVGTDDTGATARDVQRIHPIGGRLVLFDSRTVLHEVLPHSNPDGRFALTLWLGGAHSRFRALRA